MPPPSLPPFRLPWALAYLGVALWYLYSFSANWQCAEGFTSMLAVGDRFYPQSTSAFQQASPRVFENSSGYDAQFYAQIALDPSLQDPELDQGVDTLRYRARRILVPAAAWLLGAGDPTRIVHLYPLINPLCWIACALLLLRWLPPTGLQNFLRWAGILLGWGWITSTERSLADGPAATLTVLALWYLSHDRKTHGAVAMAASALAKDVSLLAGLALWRREGSLRTTLAGFVARGAICVAPLFLWWLYLNAVTPTEDRALLGSGNFALPFVGLAQQFVETAQRFDVRPTIEVVFHLLCYAGIAAQALFLLLRPRWNELWWRAGIGFAVLAAALGTAVWEDIPGAAPRVLLVLHIAFNLLLPRAKAWLPLLLLANLSVLEFPKIMAPPELSRRTERCIENRRFLQLGPGLSREQIGFAAGEGWYPAESAGGSLWKWSAEAGSIIIENRADSPLPVLLSLRLGTHYPRTAIVALNGETLLRFPQDRETRTYPIGLVTLQPGTNQLLLTGEPAAQAPGNGDSRPLGVALHRLVLDPPPAAP